MSSSLNRRLPTEWECRWAPAYQWSSLVFNPKFRQEVTDYVFDIRSNRRYYRSEPPGTVSFNYCPCCAAGRRYDCFFFHPGVAAIFLDVVKSLDKTKREPELNNLEVQLRILKKLPNLFGRLGHPCAIGEIGDYGFVWSCIKDKLDQSFPYDCLLMVDNCRYIELYKQDLISESEDSECDIDIDKLDNLYLEMQPDRYYHDSYM